LIFGSLGLLALLSATYVLHSARNAILYHQSWQSGMEFAYYLEHDFPLLEDTLAGRGDHAVIESELLSVANLGNVFRFEFNNAEGELTFVTGAFHPHTDGMGASHHTNNHDDGGAVAAHLNPSHDNVLIGDPASHRSGIDAIRSVIFGNEAYSHGHPGFTLSGTDDGSSMDGGDPFQFTGHHLDILSGDGITLPAAFVHMHHPLTDDAGGIRGAMTLYIDVSDRAILIDQVLFVASGSILALFVFAIAGPTFAYISASHAKKTADARVRFLAGHDSLTGAMNRGTLMPMVETSFIEGERLAVHLIDVDNFKYLNDIFGHDVGDCVLKTIVKRLKAVAGPSAYIARMGGDEFAIVQTGAPLEADINKLATDIVEAVGTPIEARGHSVAATVSVGSAASPDDGAYAARLIKSADLAMYQAKAKGRNGHCRYMAWMDQELDNRRLIEDRLKWALKQQQFTLNYQPLYKAGGTELSGFEALLRLNGEDGEPISPDVFVPIAEQMGLIEEIGNWVLNTGCKFAATWPEGLKLAVNLSVGQFSSGQIVETVAKAMRDAGITPNRLELEITESMLMDDQRHALEQLRALKELGVSVAMDDFGTGYSSLAYLWQFPFDRLKIDQSFMRGFDDQSPRITRIVETIIGLGHTLEMDITAEGVETGAQLEMLRSARCDQIQGFFLGRPGTETEAMAIIMAYQNQKSPSALRSAETNLSLTRKEA